MSENLKIKNIKGNFGTCKEIINTKGLPELIDCGEKINENLNEVVSLNKSTSRYQFYKGKAIFTALQGIPEFEALNYHDLGVFVAICNISLFYQCSGSSTFLVTPLQIQQMMTQNFSLTRITEKNKNLIDLSMRKLKAIEITLKDIEINFDLIEKGSEILDLLKSIGVSPEKSSHITVGGSLLSYLFIENAEKYEYESGHKFNGRIYSIDKKMPLLIYSRAINENLYIPEAWYEKVYENENCSEKGEALNKVEAEAKNRNLSVEFSLLVEYIFTMVVKRKNLNIKKFDISFIHAKDELGLYSRLGYCWDVEDENGEKINDSWYSIFDTDESNKPIVKKDWTHKSKKIRKNVKNILKKLQTAGEIASFEEYKDGRTVTGVKVYLKPD